MPTCRQCLLAFLGIVFDKRVTCQLDKSVVNENSLHILKIKHRTDIPANAHLLAVRQVHSRVFIHPSLHLGPQPLR